MEQNEPRLFIYDDTVKVGNTCKVSSQCLKCIITTDVNLLIQYKNSKGIISLVTIKTISTMESHDWLDIRCKLAHRIRKQYRYHRS